MARSKNALGQRVKEILDTSFRERIPSKYGLRIRVLPAGYKHHADVIVITDYFRGKNFFKRLDIVDEVLNEALPPAKQFGINIIPFTEREAQERGL